MTETLRKHPFWTWLSIAVTAGGLLFAALGVWWTIQDEQKENKWQRTKVIEIRNDQQKIRKELAIQTVTLKGIEERQRRIREEQVAIRKELATQTVSLKNIEGRQQRRFDKMEAEHKWLSSEINKALGAMSISIGRILEREIK